MKLTRELQYFITLTSVTILVIVAISLASATLFFNFASEFLAVILGILLVFATDRLWEAEKNKNQRKNLLANLHVELKRIRNVLGKGNLLYPEIWDSAVSSGELRLLTSEQVTKLANLYALIKGTEYEAKRVRDTAEDYRRAIGSSEAEILNNRWSITWKNQSEREKDLRQKIDDILKEEWWTEK